MSVGVVFRTATSLKMLKSKKDHMQKLQNRPITKEEARQLDDFWSAKKSAKKQAKASLKAWYATAYKQANAQIPKMQIDYNLKIVSAMPGWLLSKGQRNGYVMLYSLFSGTLIPVILELDYESHCTGGLTYRQLHLQVREHFKLESHVSLRMCPDRPWYRHMQSRIPFPAHRALGVSDAQCRHLLGATLLYYTYVHLTDPR